MRETPGTHAQNVGNDVHGIARLELAKIVKAALTQAGALWVLDGGTLLGAYRNGKLIPHDDDFDIATYIPDFNGAQHLESLRRSLRPLVPAPYEIRAVTSYASKLEIYDPSSENYILPTHRYKGADFHTVTVDVQVMTDAPDGSVIYVHDLLQHVRVPKDSIEPIGEIECEGTAFNCPNHPERFLGAQYGYLGTDARFDEQTKMYVKAS